MAYYLRYQHSFKDERGQQWKIEIYKESSITLQIFDLECGSSPIVINYRNSGDEKYSSIKSSVAIINIKVIENFDYRELITFEERDFKVILKKGNYDYWVGYCVSDTFQEEYIDTPYNFQLRALDGLALLKNNNFNTGNVGEPNVPRENVESLLDGVRFCLSKTGLGINLIEGINLRNTLHTYTTTTSTLSQFSYDPLRFAKVETFDNEKVLTCGDCYKALEGILRSFTARIYQRFYNNEVVWWIERINEKNHYAGTPTLKPYYRKWGAAVGDPIIGTEFDVDDHIEIGLPSNPTWNDEALFLNSDQVLEYGKPYYKVVNTFEQDGRASGVLIEDGNFEDAAWSNTTTLIKWTKDGSGTLIEKSLPLVVPYSDFSVRIKNSGNGWIRSTTRHLAKSAIGKKLKITLFTKQEVSPSNNYYSWWAEQKSDIRIRVRIQNAKDINDNSVGTQYLWFNYSYGQITQWNGNITDCILHPNQILDHLIIADIQYYGNLDIQLFQADNGTIWPYINQPWISVMVDYDIWYDYVNINVIEDGSSGSNQVIFSVQNNSAPSNNTSGVFDWSQPLGDDVSGLSRGALWLTSPVTYTNNQWTRRGFSETLNLANLNAQEIMRNYKGVQRMLSGTIRQGNIIHFWNTVLIDEIVPPAITATRYYYICQSLMFDVRANTVSGEWLANITDAVTVTTIVKTKFENVGVPIGGGGGQTAKVGGGGGVLNGTTLNEVGGYLGSGDIQYQNIAVQGSSIYEEDITADTYYAVNPLNGAYQKLEIDNDITFIVRIIDGISSPLTLEVYNSNGVGVTLTLGMGFSFSSTAGDANISFSANKKKLITFVGSPYGYRKVSEVSDFVTATDDTDAAAYITLLSSPTEDEKFYIRFLIANLKSKSLWSKALAIYPFPTSIESDCEINLANPGTYDLSFTGNWTFTNEGAEVDNTDAFTHSYADTGIAADTLTANDYALSVYLGKYEKDDVSAIGSVGSATSSKLELLPFNSSGNLVYNHVDLSLSYADSDSRGFTHATYNSGVKVYKNGTKVINSVTGYTGVLPTYNLYIGGTNEDGGLERGGNNEFRFVAIWNSKFTDAESENLYNILQNAQDILSRKIVL